MSIVPKALLRRLYIKGSLRTVENGVAFDIKNVLGPGIITRINVIFLNEIKYTPDKIVVRTKDKNIRADQISPENPILFTFNQKGTCILVGNGTVANGNNQIDFELESREAGLVNITINDKININ